MNGVTTRQGMSQPASWVRTWPMNSAEFKGSKNTKVDLRFLSHALSGLTYWTNSSGMGQSPDILKLYVPPQFPNELITCTCYSPASHCDSAHLRPAGDCWCILAQSICLFSVHEPQRKINCVPFCRCCTLANLPQCQFQFLVGFNFRWYNMTTILTDKNYAVLKTACDFGSSCGIIYLT